MRIDLRLCKTVRSTDCWGDLQSLRNLRQFVREGIDGGKPETNRAKKLRLDWPRSRARLRMRKAASRNSEPGKKSSPSAISRKGGMCTEAKVRPNVATTNW